MSNSGGGALPKKERLILEFLTSVGPMYGLQLVEHSDAPSSRGPSM
jgi:hypothetical protein